MIEGCEMYVATFPKYSYTNVGEVRGRGILLMCGDCGYVTTDTQVCYCPGCGKHVANVIDEGDEVWIASK